MKHGIEFNEFWEDYLRSNRNVIYVLGRGFDPRMCTGIDAIINAGGNGKRDCLLIEFDEGPDSPSMRHNKRVLDNINHLKSIIQSRGDVLSKSLRMWSDDGPGRRRVGSRSAARIFSNISDFGDYTDIIIDISAMPLVIYFSLIGKTLYLLDYSRKNNPSKTIPNLHIVVAEYAELDQRIRDAGIDENADYVHGFGGNMDMEATAGVPKIWIPILGEGKIGHLERIYARINPDEICPVLPSPSLNPRRGDDLIIQYREILFDQWRIDPRNIIYAQEQNPFEAYRQIYRAACYYNQSLGPLGGCKAAVSAVSSKLISIGALLAAFELRDKMNIGIAHVEAQGYEMDETNIDANFKREAELFTLWLDGDCYNE